MTQKIKLTKEQTEEVDLLFDQCEVHDETIRKLSLEAGRLKNEGMKLLRKWYPEIVGKDWTYQYGELKIGEDEEEINEDTK